VRPKVLVCCAWGCAAGLWLAVQIAFHAGLRINHTPSLPIGLWQLQPRRGALQLGEIVSFCPPRGAIRDQARERGTIARGTCEGGTEPLLKQVYAVAGDWVKVDVLGLSVNGRRIAGTRPRPKDVQGRPIVAFPFGVYRLRRGEFWAGSRRHLRSFDSRYFGPVQESDVLGIAQRVQF
jgi:conjugative transfer signal peptidase TraF